MASLMIMLALLCSAFYVEGQPPNAANADINTRLLNLEGNQISIKLKVNLMFEQLKNDVGKQLPELLKNSLKNMLRNTDVDAVLKGSVVREVRRIRRKYKKLKVEVLATNTRINDLEKKNDELENDIALLNQSTKENSNSGCEEREITPTPALLHQSTEENSSIGWEERETTPTPSLLHQSTEENSSIGWEERETTPTSAEFSREMTRILILPWGHDQPQQIDMGNLTVTSYPLKRQGYQSVVYHRKSRSVISTVVEPFNFGSKIYIADLDNGEQTELLNGQASQGIAVDDDRELIIFATVKPRKALFSMNIDGSNLTRHVDLTRYGYASSIALDTSTETMYVNTERQLLVMTYQGGNIRAVSTGSNMRAVTMDVAGRAVYFNDEAKIKKLSLADGTTTLIADLNFLPWNFVYYGQDGLGVLYVSSFRNKKIGKIELDGNNAYVPILSGCTPCHHTTSMCLLP